MYENRHYYSQCGSKMQKSKPSSQDGLINLDQRSLEGELAHEVSSLVAKSIQMDRSQVPCDDGIANVKYLGRGKIYQRN